MASGFQQDRADIERALVQAARGGDEDSFHRLVESIRPALWTFLVRQIGDHEEAADLFQEICLRAWQGLRRYRHRDRFRSWIFRIAHNLCRDRRRRLGARVRLVAADTVPERAVPADAEQQLWAGHRRQRLLQALASLPDTQRDVFLLRMHSEMTFREIAALQEVSASTALSRMSLAVEKLRRALEEE